ncbi:hypothetical protein ACFL34_00960, partial [Candidatus Sumerlaeota bacterium]
ARFSGFAASLGASYTRYADDLTFSLPKGCDRRAANRVILFAKSTLDEFGYRLHLSRKLQIRRRHQQQRVTGLVVNEQVALPRATRRWLRAVRHRLAHNRPATLKPSQLQGWEALEQMVRSQSRAEEDGAG